MIRRLLLASAAGLFPLALAAAAPAAAAGPLKVVATFSILGDIVATVGKERVAVTTLVGPGGDAHVYQPTPSDARTLLRADIVFVNGLGFEGFLDRLLTASEYKGPIVTAAAAVTPREMAEEEEHGDDHAEAEHDHDHAAGEEDHAEAGGHHHEGTDPHAWQDLSNGVLYAEAVRDGLCKADPDGCTAYTANASAYVAEMKALDADLRARVSAVPAERRTVITSHDAFGYFGAAYGIRFLAPQGVSTDSEASAADVATLVRQIRETGVKVLFVENISDPRLIEQIAKESGARLGGALYSDALSKPGEGGDTYLGMMRHNADALVGAMEGNS